MLTCALVLVNLIFIVMKTNILKNNKVYLTLMILFLAKLVNAQTIMQPTTVTDKALLKDMIQQHLVYPQDALDKGLKGKVTVTFTVDKSGNAFGHKAENAFDEECAAQAIHLVKLIQWKPATRDHLPIEYQHEYTINFSPKTYLKNMEKYKSIPQQEETIDTSYIIYKSKQLDRAPKPYFNKQNITIGAYLRSELKYPDHAKEFEISGTVKLSFIIETDGKASNIVIENSVGGGCDNEAIRLIQNLNWIPGVKDGQLVRTHTTQDITFQFGERNYHDGNQY